MEIIGDVIKKRQNVSVEDEYPRMCDSFEHITDEMFELFKRNSQTTVQQI